MSKKSPVHWLPVAEGARERGIPERTFRRRLLALHAKLGGGVLRSYNKPGTRVRKWHFNPEKAVLAVEEQPVLEDVAERLDALTFRVEECEKKEEALRQSLNSVKAKVKSKARNAAA